MQHPVAGIGNHAWLDLDPDNPADFANNPLFNTPGNPNRSTISGEPSPAYNPLSEFPKQISTLNSTPNSDLSSCPSAKVLIPTPKGMTDTQFIQALLAAAQSFNNGTIPYAALPQNGGPAHNSNSFAAGVLSQVGLNGSQLVSGLPGWQPGAQYPVPARSFGTK
jgi:hypothetical protein